MKSQKKLLKNLVADYLIQIRKERGLSQEEMAEMLNISAKSYANLERRKFLISTISLLFLLRHLGKEDAIKFSRFVWDRIMEPESQKTGEGSHVTA